MIHRSAFYLTLTALACFAWRTASSADSPLPVAMPAEVGMSADHLQRVEQMLRTAVDGRQIAGGAARVARRGRLIYGVNVGFQDAEARLPVRDDTLFRIASMTKPITSAAALMLVEQGKLRLDDPVSRYVPDFAAPNVLRSDAAGTADETAAERPITVRHLLTHTSGLTYGFFDRPRLGAAYRDQQVSDGIVETTWSLAENMRRLAAIPLHHQPGTAWEYGLSTDLLGRVVEVAAGESLDEFLRRAIFEPLRMTSTFFFVPAAQRNRLAALYAPGDEQTIRPVGAGPQLVGAFTYSATYPLRPPDAFCSGGAGLVSTAGDYVRFLQMLLNGGELDGVRILRPNTVRNMTQNQIGELTVTLGGHGSRFGWGFAVKSAAGEGDPASVGTYSWGGIFNTFFFVDPQEELVGVLMTQIYPHDHLSLRSDFQRLTYAALSERVAGVADAGAGPQPGDVYREFVLHNDGDDWRVTDPSATPDGAKRYLPNPVLQLKGVDLEGAIRAEAMLDRWGGHLQTTAKRIRFNQRDWLTIPELTTVPAGHRPELYYAQDNPIVPVPLADLQPGDNTIEGTCSTIGGYNWGQWGLYSVLLRVYYDPGRRPHPRASITSPRTGASLTDNPDITVAASSPNGVARVDVLARYDGYDEDGDGRFEDWHQAYFQPARGAPAELREHVGTAWREPYRVPWDTHWVPDQVPDAVQLVARVQDSRGTWYVSPRVERLTLVRPDVSVKMYRVTELPERFGVRAGRRQSCRINASLADAAGIVTEAVLALRTWHGWDGHHHPLQWNGQMLPLGGKNHHYDYDLLTVPADSVQTTNVFEIHSETEHHMLEVLWPGPALLVRYRLR
ncbi:MAG: serine hydrolase [Pirellulaceae bacterium]